jgi:uncharacterized protein (DUF305 family)
MRGLPGRRVTRLLAVVLLAGCARGVPQTGAVPEHEHATPPPVTTHAQAIAKVRADSVRRPYTQADVDFMTQMVGHHAQAIVMSRMAPTHGASAAVQRLAARIINAQVDEITLMQQWLADRQKPIPMAHTTGPIHEGHESMHHMAPGMLTTEQLRQLDAARGAEFDRLFLTYMIQHHRGAIAMVKTLFGTYGAGQDDTVFRFASDVNVDQSTEVARMEQMLNSLSTTSQPTSP